MRHGRRFGYSGAMRSGACIALLALAGCASGDSSGTDKLANVLFLGSANPPPAPAATTEIDCPRVEIQPGTSSIQLFERGKDGDAHSLRYQASFGNLARECSDQGSEIGVRIGLTGRVIVGPKGTTGNSLPLPIRVALVDTDSNPKISRLFNISAAIPSGQTNVDFQLIEDLGSVPKSETGFSRWRILVGFDSDATPERVNARAEAAAARRARAAQAPVRPVVQRRPPQPRQSAPSGNGPNLPPIYPRGAPAQQQPSSGPNLPPIQP